tara:strand:+ start:246 stop:791 length:546 start_codon:yes stop_codon:yes gene_type:complete
MTKQTIIEFEYGDVVIDLDRQYTVYGDFMLGEDLVKLDLTHIPWLDELSVMEDLSHRQMLTILYHPTVIHSLHTETESSPYWGKQADDCLVIYKRLSSSNKLRMEKNAINRRKMLSPYDIGCDKGRVRKSLIINRIVKLGYSRDLVKLYVNKYIKLNGTGVFNLVEGEVVEIMDKFIIDQN